MVVILTSLLSWQLFFGTTTDFVGKYIRLILMHKGG